MLPVTARRSGLRWAGSIFSVLTAFSVVACGSAKPPPVDNSADASSPAQISSPAAEPTDTEPPTDPLGPVTRTEKFNITAKGGYEAVVTLRWHAIQDATVDALYPDCVSFVNLNHGNDASPESLTIRTLIVEGSASFPEVNGFAWSTSEVGGITLKASGEEPSPIRCTDVAADGPAGLDQVSLSPEQPTFHFAFVHTAAKSPKDPKGDIGKSYLEDELTASGTYLEKCTGGQTDSGPQIRVSCYSTYGGK